ncbi:hypothetical protein A2160_02530 [Candidatus Beckwithbacteria bacterium RBG_13_42_9]|uniref:Xylose isomerase-like TIM barrel domain-containing protein n=1 Tax=Candidatus Beckwithbacteria bacterium RBG_13_42_9 TaxID=1797457 RepID=A0A1F5E7F1_9BACT|nr:MAG: hypothetical protein A2160_02530 [Candidatus Beckwithbacteria bacterium RBG_13_42_9]
MFRLGLKLWSTNEYYKAEALRLFKKGVCDYIELYAVPNSYLRYINIWSKLEIPFVIHAPHFLGGGLNLAKKECKRKNLKLIKEAQQFADKLKADKIIVHPGIDGDIKETTRQLQFINDSRILIENLPYYSIKNNLMCNGATIEELNWIFNNCPVGFCLDIGHAIYAANAQKVNPLNYLKQLIQLKPNIYHLVDGNYSGVHDRHDHFGKGSFPLEDIIALLPSDAMITIETKKDSPHNLNGFIEDIKLLKSYL